MKKVNLHKLVFMALCCSLGMSVKKVINPFANVITDSLHIPGGISTGFSLMFIVIAAELLKLRGCGTMMGAVQGALALFTGRVGSMGALSFVGYLVPGMAVDAMFYALKGPRFSGEERMAFANAASSLAASLTANVIVFRLWGAALLLYLGVSAISGLIFGLLGSKIVKRIASAVKF